DLLRRFWRSSAAAKRGASYTETKAARGILMLVTRLRKRRAKEEVVPYVLVQDVASTWEQYERVTAPTVEPVPQGLILHVAGPTADGFRIGRRLGEQGRVGALQRGADRARRRRPRRSGASRADVPRLRCGPRRHDRRCASVNSTRGG